ncbi:Non-hemolytic phospholipase C [compost metagenome]
MQKQAETLPEEINRLQEASPSDEATAVKAREAIKAKQEVLDNARSELSKWNREAFDRLSAKEKELYNSAFSINNADPHFRSIAELTYFDKGKERKVVVPKGDVLYQFRQDVKQGKLPLVSWLASPQNFSDHPSAPWYGAWYVSEVLDILTKNPEVWKKTIFIVTYDENDGYFDHIPPFSIPDDKQPDTGKCSAGIETETEHVRLDNELKQGIPKNQAREGAIGLGFRVPLLIASPWSRGGRVCSEVFDHTSTLQFLETFVNRKYDKNIRLNNISEWRRTICGDLTSVFRPYNGSELIPLPFLDRDKNVETIYNAKFKAEPGGFKKLGDNEIAKMGSFPMLAGLQEKGIRPSCALPYELYVQRNRDMDKRRITLSFRAEDKVFGDRSTGSPFTVYAPVKYRNAQGEDETSKNWWFAVKAGDELNYSWPLSAFDGGKYHLRVHGPNGFYREFIGDEHRPALDVNVFYEKNQKSGRLTGNLILDLKNNDHIVQIVKIQDNAYKRIAQQKQIGAGQRVSLVINLAASYRWYDLSITIAGNASFKEQFAGRVETGEEGMTDPLMGTTT